MAIFNRTLILRMESGTCKGRGLVIEPKRSMRFFYGGGIMGGYFNINNEYKGEDYEKRD